MPVFVAAVQDVPQWAERQHFGAAYSERGLTPRRTRRLLRQAERRHRKLVVRLAVGKPLDEHAYFSVLVHSHLLAANRESASPDAGKRIDLLLQQLSTSYSEHGAMRTAVWQLRVQADRDRIVAYQVGVSALASAYGPPRTTLAAWLAPLLSLAGFWIFYRLAIQAARRFVLQVQAVVDLFRLHLLDALNIERPGAPTEEQPIWTELRRFVVQGEVPTRHIRFTEPGRTDPGSTTSEANAT
jgi:hypothetical protein